jgi:flagellar biosynthesis chaperone FliJ
MKRYHFALDAVLRVRRAQEEAAGFALAHANQQRQRAEEAHRAALARCDELVMYRQPQDHDSFNRERDVTERRAAAVTAAVAACDFASAVAAARLADWSEAAKLVAAVERLDERRREEWRLEMQRAEMAAIDESALAGWRADTAAGSMRPGVGVSV